VPAIKATLEQYSPILKTLEDAKANCSPEVSARASSLLARFRDPLTLFGLKMAQDVLSPLDSVNRSLQSPAMTVAGMLQCVKTVKQHLQSKRPNDRFAKLLSEVERQIAEYELDPLTVPRARKPPAHFCGQVQAFHTTSVETYYRIDYVKLIDVAVQQLHDRLLNCPGLARYCQLESTQPLTGQLSYVVCQYPELGEIRSLQTQLDMFLSLPEITGSAPLTLDICTGVLRNMIPETRAMFSNVESLARLLLVNPATSATAERSFSGLRRLPTIC